MIPNSKLLLFSILISLLLSLSTVHSETCSSGMRKTYLDNTNTNIIGAARRIPLSIAYYEARGGAVWFNRRILVEPRFEVHLKVSVTDLTKDQDDWQHIIDGWSIVISTTSNKLGYPYGAIGYQDFTNSYVVETDLFQNAGDFSCNTLSIHKCTGTAVCSASESGTKQVNLVNQIYNPSVPQTFDIRLMYSDGVVKVYSGDQQMLTDNFNFTDVYGSEALYLGFTGFFRGNRKELNMLGSFICEDNYDVTKMNGHFLVNGEVKDSVTVKAGGIITYLFCFINSKNQIIPHAYNLGIWSYTFYLNVPCGDFYQQGQLNKYFIYLKLNKCTVAGVYGLSITSVQHGQCPDVPYTVIADDLNKITFRGHDGSTADVEKVDCTKYGSGICKFNWGTSSGDFVYTNGMTFTIDFNLTDVYGNIVDLGTTTSSGILSKTGLLVKSTAELTYTMKKTSNYYQLVINVKSPGTFDIPANSFLSTTYRFIVLAGTPSSVKSTCQLYNVSGKAYYVSSPTISSGTEIEYRCTLKDEYGNVVDPTVVAATYGIGAGCKVEKTAPSTSTTDLTITTTSSYFSCKTTASTMGSYTFSGYFYKTSSSSTKTTVTPSINAYKVTNVPTSFIGAYFYSFYTAKWSTATSFTYKSDSSSLVGLIDLTDTDGKTLMSTFEYSANFKAESITGTLSSEHNKSDNLGSLVGKYYTLNNKKYIGIYFANGGSTDNYVKRSSFNYIITLKLGTNSISYTMLYPLSNIGTYKTCYHDLNIQNTKFTLYSDPISFYVGQQVNAADVFLQTNDNLLYNYNIGLSSFILTVSPQATNTYATITADSSVNGKYLLKVTSQVSGQYTLGVKINNVLVKSIPFTVLSTNIASFEVPNSEKYTISNNVYTFKESTTTDANPTMCFKAKDKFNNYITQADNSNLYGMTIRLTVDGKTAIASITYLLSYDSSAGCYKLEDTYKALGTFQIELKSTETGNTIYFKYTKIPGNININFTNGAIVSSQIIINSKSYVEITYYDGTYMNIGNNEALYNDAVSKTTVTATGPKTYTYVYEGKTSTNKARFAATIDKTGTFTVKATYGSSSIRMTTNTFTSSYEVIDLSKSTMQVMLDVMNEISTETKLNVKNLVDRPVYKLTFKNSEGEVIEYVDPNTNIAADMIGPDEYSTNLVMTKGNNYRTWKYLDTEDLKYLVSGDYYLQIYLDSKVALSYPLNFLGNGNDTDAGNGDYDLSKTFFSVTTISGVAGKSYDVNIEFRTKENKRWNKPGDPSLFTFTNSLKLSNTDLDIKTQRGGKAGQFIITVTQKKSTETGKPNILTSLYEGGTIGQTLSIAIKCDDLSSLVVDSTCLVSSTSTELKSGTVLSIPKITFVPYDKYGNVFTDLFSTSTFSQDRLSTLININHSADAAVVSTPVADAANKKLSLTLSTQIKGTLTLSSIFISGKKYTLKVANGPIDIKYTVAEIVGSTEGTAGNTFTFAIYPKDIYSNTLDDLSTSDFNKFKLTVVNPRTGDKVLDNATLKSTYIQYTTSLTEAGDVHFKPTLSSSGESIKCTKCAAKVNIAELDYLKTKVFFNTNELNPSESFRIDSSSSPKFTVSFFDQFGNQIENIDNYSITSTFTGNDADIAFCTEKANNNYNVFVCREGENPRKWFYLINGDYEMKIINKEGTTLTYKLELFGSEASDGSNGPVNPALTQFSVTTLTNTAGVQNEFFIELKAEDGKRKNYWYVDPTTQIIPTFEKEKCTWNVILAEKPGQYYVQVTCNTSTLGTTGNSLYLVIEGVKVDYKVTIDVNPNKATHGYFIDSSKKKIPETSLPEANADNSYSLQLCLYDKYENVANQEIATVTYSIVPPSDHSDFNVVSSIVKNSDYTFKVDIQPIYSGQYTIKSLYFTNDYTFSTRPGAVYASNSVMFTAEESAIAGETVKAYIIPYDKNNNYVDPTKYISVNPFSVSYKFQVDGTYVNYIELTNAKIENFSFGAKTFNTFAYSNVLTHKDSNYYRATMGNSELKCLRCIVVVNAGPMSFENSKFMRFDTSSGTFQEITDSSVEDNTKVDLIYRIYPRDAYGNEIETLTNLSKYSITLEKDVVYPLALSNTDDGKQQYAEFQKKDVIGATYSYDTLTGGNYTVTFSDGTSQVVKYVTLKGKPDDEFASNQELDPQKTHINSESLSYVAGNVGEMFIEVRTINNLRKNWWGTYTFTIENCVSQAEDPSFTYSQEKSGTLGVFYITVQSTLANTYPVAKECRLKIYLDGELITALSPNMQVSPNVIAKTSVKSEYIKQGNTLLDGNADTPYVFVMQTFDKYNNLNQGDVETIGLTCTRKSENVNMTAKLDATTGELEYIVNNTVAGTYTINSKNDKNDSPYLAHSLTFENKHGEVTASTSKIEVSTIVIEAGEEGKVIITPMDSNGNVIPGKDAQGKFVVEVKESGSTTPVIAEENVINDKLEYSTILTKAGDAEWTIKFNDEEIAGEVIYKTTVNPSDADPTKSTVYVMNSLNTLVEYKNNTQISAQTVKPIEIHVNITDTYGNSITEIPNDVTITNAVLKGNDMEPITLELSRDSQSELIVRIPSLKEDEYKHLVSSSDYTIDFTVSTPEGSASYHYNVLLVSDKDDSGYGNGPYYADKSTLNPTSVVIYAGSSAAINLLVKTAKGLLYHNVISMDDISYQLLNTDSTFDLVKTNPGDQYANFTLRITSQKASTNTLTIMLKEKSGTIKTVGTVSLVVKPKVQPDPSKTQIIMKPDSEIIAGKAIEIKFQLFDQYGNQFTEMEDIISNMTVFQNDVKVSDPQITLQGDQKTYYISYIPSYPPRTLDIKVQYVNSDGDITYLFPNNIKTSVISQADYSNTVFTSSNADEMEAGNTLDMNAAFYDQQNICVDKEISKNELPIIKVTGPVENPEISKEYEYHFIPKIEPGRECNNLYTINGTQVSNYTNAGTYTIDIIKDGNKIKQYTQTVIAGPYNISNFKVVYADKGFNPNNVLAGDSFRFNITGADSYKNPQNSKLLNSITVNCLLNKKVPDKVCSFTYEEYQEGVLTVTALINGTGLFEFEYAYNQVKLPKINNDEGPQTVMVVAGLCSAEHPVVDWSEVEKLTKPGEPTTFTIKCYDKYNNLVTVGGIEFTIVATLLVGEVQTTVKTTVTDKNTGEYEVAMTPPLAGEYKIDIALGVDAYTSYKFSLESGATSCEGDTPYSCPNSDKCVAKQRDCIEDPYRNDECPDEAPFYCATVQGSTDKECVSSMIKCACPEGYTKCGWMNYCIPDAEVENMCPFGLPVNCKKYPGYTKKCKDEICRARLELAPSQRVCPVGYVLCPDLTCQTDHSKCLIYPACPDDQVQCVDQSCASDASKCPTTITCTDPSQVACPDGTCVDNEVECQALPKCADPTPFLCANNACSSSYSECPKSISCGHTFALCSDMICRNDC